MISYGVQLLLILVEDGSVLKWDAKKEVEQKQHRVLLLWTTTTGLTVTGACELSQLNKNLEAAWGRC